MSKNAVVISMGQTTILSPCGKSNPWLHAHRRDAYPKHWGTGRIIKSPALYWRIMCDVAFFCRLMTGLLLFSLILVCCWLRYHRYHSKESIESAKLGYVPVPGTVITYGDEYYIHQQPPQVPFAREPPHFTKPLEYESQQQHDSSRYYPPPYNYIERRTPSAPPEDTY